MVGVHGLPTVLAAEPVEEALKQEPGENTSFCYCSHRLFSGPAPVHHLPAVAHPVLEAHLKTPTATVSAVVRETLQNPSKIIASGSPLPPPFCYYFGLLFHPAKSGSTSLEAHLSATPGVVVTDFCYIC